jgi:hypothetical protein
LSSLLRFLKVDLRDVYFAAASSSILNHRHLFGAWENIDFALFELHNGRLAREMFLDDPDCPIPGVRLEEHLTSDTGEIADIPTGSPSQSQVPETSSERVPLLDDHNELVRSDDVEQNSDNSPVVSESPDLSVANAEPSYREECRYVDWFGIEYAFSPNQATVVKVLWEAAAASRTGIRSLTAIAILESAFGRNHMAPLRDTFKRHGNSGLRGPDRYHAAWRTMIVKTEGTKDMFQLSRPVPRARHGSAG